MNAIRLIYDAVPDSLSVPPSMRRRRAEVVFLALDEETVPAPTESIRDDWPAGFFEQTAGAIPDLPERDTQGEQPTREPFP
ncbi:hypothetical protein [uncultured Thiodictyon sp.]|uniref:hypothetical protein n=1 Tax=uncultured Thiodictyon sp. TaxID=1846217 RepID=UPI0025F598EE|nr:hypothetical protein [uncultured Thiodictyon sp.]